MTGVRAAGLFLLSFCSLAFTYSQELQHLDSLEGKSFVQYYQYPIPEVIEGRLFFIQRNISKNVVVYDANLTDEGELDLRRPVKMYWKRYNENQGGKEFELTWLERTMGYRLKVTNTSPNNCQVALISYKKRKFNIIKTEKGQVEARIRINGREAKMSYIFMHMQDTFWPDVNYLEIGGIDLETGEYIFEQFLP